MILKNSLYTIVGKTMKEQAVTYDIQLDASHLIYQAHFPEEPVTPGVCIIQIAKELLEDHLQQQLSIRMVKNVKFVAIISPLQNPRVTYELQKIEADEEAGTFRVTADVHDSISGTAFSKISMTCSR